MDCVSEKVDTGRGGPYILPISDAVSLETGRRPMAKILTTRRRNAYPGDRAVVLTRAATDTTGREWPRGSVLTPMAAGHDNVAGVAYQQCSEARFERA